MIQLLQLGFLQAILDLMQAKQKCMFPWTAILKPFAKFPLNCPCLWNVTSSRVPCGPMRSLHSMVIVCRPMRIQHAGFWSLYWRKVTPHTGRVIHGSSCFRYLTVKMTGLKCLSVLLLILANDVLGGRDFYKILGVSKRADTNQILGKYIFFFLECAVRSE